MHTGGQSSVGYCGNEADLTALSSVDVKKTELHLHSRKHLHVMVLNAAQGQIYRYLSNGRYSSPDYVTATG